MLEDVDAGVGRIVRTLDELGLSDDTLIVFTSDNGGALRVTKNTPRAPARERFTKAASARRSSSRGPAGSIRERPATRR